uniref:Anillin-like protein 2 n=1 Tax=Ascaris suum TaxID=6253 RepID=F1KQ17_ASCSU
MRRGGRRSRGSGAWRWDNHGGGGSSNAHRSGDEQWHYFWGDGGDGPQQRSGFYDGEYYSEGDSRMSSIYRQAWSGLTSRDGGSRSIAAWQQEVQQRMSIAGDVDIFDQSSAVVAPHVRGVAAEGAIDARSELSTNGPGNSNQLLSYSMQENLSAAGVTSVGTCLQGGVDLSQMHTHPTAVEQSEGTGDLQVENTVNVHEEVSGTTAYPQQTFFNVDENVGVEAVMCDGHSAMPIQPTEAFDDADGRPVAAPRSRHWSAASHRSGVSCHSGVIPSRVDGSVIESGALIGENEDESANERFHRGGETQLASPSSTQYEDERHWSFILGVDNDVIDDVTADDHRERTNSVGSASSKRNEAEIRLLNVGELQRSEDLSERISVETASRRSSICSTQSVENRDARLANVNSSERDLSTRFVNIDGREHRGRIRTLSLRNVHDEQPLRAYPHYASDHQLASRGRRNGADASVQQHRALHTDTAHQENLLPHLKAHGGDNVAQEAIQTTNLDRSSSAHSVHKSYLEGALGGLSGGMEDEANISVRASSMGSRHIVANEMGIDASQVTSRDTEERSEIVRSRSVSACSHRSKGIGGTKEHIANDDLVASKGATYLAHNSGSAGNLLTAVNIVDGNFERTSSALSSRHLCGDYRMSTQRVRTMSLRTTSDLPKDLQPLDSYRRYTSDCQLIPAISDSATVVEKRTSSEISGLRQDEDVKLLKQAGADDKPGGDVIAATGHTACKSRSASVASALIVGCSDEMGGGRGVLPHVPTFELADDHQTRITRTSSLRDWNRLTDDQSLIGCDRYLSEGRLVREAVNSGLHDDFGSRGGYGSNQGAEEDRFAATADSAINSDITTTSANVEHMSHRDSTGSLHTAIPRSVHRRSRSGSLGSIGDGSSLCRSRTTSMGGNIPRSVHRRSRSGSLGSGHSALSHRSFCRNTCGHETVDRMNEGRGICSNEVISEWHSIATKNHRASACGSLNEGNERAIGMDVVGDTRGNEDLSKLLSARIAMHSTSTCSMGSESVFDKDELDGIQNDSSNIVDGSAGAADKAGDQAVIDMNSEAGVTLLLSTSCVSSAKSNINQRTHISVLNLPVACGDRGDHIGSRPHSAAEVTLKIDDEDNLLSNTESMGNDVPSYELTKVSATRSGISSTASAEDASFVSLTCDEANSKVSAAGTPSKSYNEGHILMKESGTPLMMRGDSFSNTPSSALNRTLYSRAEFEQRKAAIIEATMQQKRDSHSAWPLVYPFGSSDGSSQQQQGSILYHSPSPPRPLYKPKKPIQNFGTDVYNSKNRFKEESMEERHLESRSASMSNDNQRASRTPSHNSSSDYSTRIRSDHVASHSSISSSTRDPHIYYERVRSSKPTGHTSECPECTAEVIGESRGRDNMEHSLAALSDEISAIRHHVSRGQTRRLASLFENMVASTAGDAGLPSLRRNKSLPPPKASHEPYQHQEMLEKQSLDDSFLNERRQEGMKLCAKVPAHRAFESGDKRFFDWDSELVACKGNTKNANVRSLADRFEVASTNDRHSGPLKSVNIRPAAQEQTHSRCVTAQHEISDSVMATSGSKHPSKSYYMKEMMKGKASMCDRYDELLVGEGNSSSFWRANDPSGVIEKRTGSCTRRLQGADKMLKDERLVTPQMADSAKVEGVRGPTFDAVDKGALGRSDHNLSSVSMSTIGEMNDDADYATRIRGIQEAIRAQESRVSEVVNSVTAFGKNNVRKFAKIYVQRELLLCRERRSTLLNELKRIEALKAIKKRTPQLSTAVQSTFDVHSITVQLCKDFCRRSTGEKDSYAFLALLKTDEQVYASDAVSLIDSGVGTVRFSNHVRFDALPVDFAVTIDIYTMKIPEVRRGAEPFSARTSHKVNDTNLPYSHSKKSIFDIPLLKSCEFWRCGVVLMNRNKVGIKQLFLDSAEYPLEDVIEVKSHCSALPPILAINFGGFLNMMETVVEETSWTRYWAVLHRGTVSFWMHPDEQASDKPAVASLDLTKCINKKITPTAYKNKSLNMFVLDMLFDSALCVIEEKRVVLSADTEEFCIAWTQAINETLGILRA